ncbi:hypothetical protein MLD38_020043 [Melastoma candidum]|uniref:Uncharacterized protein n=1 Tax=Melastoma candidum TaxID=119954 RepID=A0ACB9QCY2_9MYRT|nr:hypothetical protein MLD38_020043 [Melastoma candidum]
MTKSLEANQKISQSKFPPVFDFMVPNGYFRRDKILSVLSPRILDLVAIESWAIGAKFVQNGRKRLPTHRVKPLANVPSLLGLISVKNLGLTSVVKKWKSSLAKRPKKRISYRVHELDRVMDLRKKPTLILQLKSIIESQKHQLILLRDLERHAGFVQKWNYLSIIEKYDAI